MSLYQSHEELLVAYLRQSVANLVRLIGPEATRAWLEKIIKETK